MIGGVWKCLKLWRNLAAYFTWGKTAYRKSLPKASISRTRTSSWVTTSDCPSALLISCTIQNRTCLHGHLLKLKNGLLNNTLAVIVHSLKTAVDLVSEVTDVWHFKEHRFFKMILLRLIDILYWNFLLRM